MKAGAKKIIKREVMGSTFNDRWLLGATFIFLFPKRKLGLDIAETGSRAYFGKAGVFCFSWWKAIGLCNVRYVVSMIFRHVSCTWRWEPLDCFIRVTPVQNLNPIAVVCERKWREKSWVWISPDFKPVRISSPLISCGQK